MKLFNFTIVKLTICLIAGILIGYSVTLSLIHATIIFVSLCIVFGILYVISITNDKFSSWFGACSYLCMISFGILTTNLHNEKQFSNHHTNAVTISDSISNTIIFRIREILKSSTYYDKYIIDVLDIDSLKVSGKSLLNILKDSTKQQLKVDEIYSVNTPFKKIKSPLNPYQFDYKNYLKNQNIYYQLFLSNKELFAVSTHKHTILGFAAKLREHIQEKLKHYHFSPDELAIINALLLGQRQDITKEVYSSYSQAGAIHILAVSGLHVGIILWLLNFLLKPIELFKHGPYIKITTIVILLWCFAIVAGLSASVTRAVTMFTIFAIAMHLKRPTNIYNTLAISVFVLLLIKPNFLFDVGFQLSYLAVIDIITIQPILYKVYQPKFKIDAFFWTIFTVTLAAQIGVIPLSLYYFHQFPGLFFLSNLVIIPCLGLILGLGIVIIMLASFNILPAFLAEFYSFIITTLNSFVLWISHQESFLFQNISFNSIQVLLSYLIIAAILSTIIQKSFKKVRLLLVVIIIGQIYFLFAFKINVNKEFVVFHKSRYSILGFKINNTLEVHHNLNDSLLKIDKTIMLYKVGSHARTLHFDSIKNVYQMNDKLLLIVDSLGVYKSLSFKPNFILLRNSPKINLNRLIDSLHPELIICDGSNYKSYQKRWQYTCEAKKIPFHNTNEKGAFIFNY